MSNNTPLFSIIVPVYNVEEFIHKTLSSVLAQNFNSYELIVVNDGSTDKSGDICYSLAQQHSQITFIKTANGGLSAARNIGLNVAKGQYIIFLDGDDYWEGNNVLNEIANLIKEKNEPDVILHSFKIINLNPPYPLNFDLSNLSGNYYIDFPLLISRSIYRSSACTKVIKREIIIQNNIFFLLENVMKIVSGALN